MKNTVVLLLGQILAATKAFSYIWEYYVKLMPTAAEVPAQIFEISNVSP